MARYTNQELIERIQHLFYLKDGEVFTQNRRYQSFDNRPATTFVAGHGYVYTSFSMPNGRNYSMGLHRIVWVLHNHNLPPELDHRDRDKTNNKIDNLRETTHYDNCENRGSSKVSNTNERNIYEVQGMYRVVFTRKGKVNQIANVTSLEEAIRRRDNFLLA